MFLFSFSFRLVNCQYYKLNSVLALVAVAEKFIANFGLLTATL